MVFTLLYDVLHETGGGGGLGGQAPSQGLWPFAGPQGASETAFLAPPKIEKMYRLRIMGGGGVLAYGGSWAHGGGGACVCVGGVGSGFFLVGCPPIAVGHRPTPSVLPEYDLM